MQTDLKVYCEQQHPFNCPLSGTVWVSRYQKGKTNLDFTEVRDSEWQRHHHHYHHQILFTKQNYWKLYTEQLGDMQICTLPQITTPAPHHSVFYRPDPLLAAQPTVSKHWRH